MRRRYPEWILAMRLGRVFQRFPRVAARPVRRSVQNVLYEATTVPSAAVTTANAAAATNA